MSQNENKNTDFEILIDPDYENTHTAILNAELKEEEENKLTEDKLKAIIKGEFDKELNIRQNQLEEIEEKIFRAQKLLHVVRYVLISSYYNKKALEYENGGNSALECTNILTGQNRIHPAVKKLLGSNVNDLKFLTARSKRKAATKTEQGILEPSESKRIKLDLSTSHPNQAIPDVNLQQEKETKVEVITNRKKVQHKLVIGNISYFKKSLEQDNLTHKWMVYVKIFRGSQDEVSNQIISRVVFYLHSSYKPHDVVEIGHPPYHLSRRGWGEFPLRVQIYFKSSMNKPVDVIHNLKLDKTFSERQTLGNETTVPLFLYEESLPSYSLEHNESPLFQPVFNSLNTNLNDLATLSSPPNSQLIQEEKNVVDIKIEPSTSYEEHNYCYDNISIKEEEMAVKEEIISDDFYNIPSQTQNLLVKSVENSVCLHDHSYSLPPSKQGQKSTLKRHKIPVKQAYNELIYGLGVNYLDTIRSKARTVKPKLVEKANHQTDKNAKSAFKVLKTVTGQSIRFLPESFSQVLLKNGSVVSVKFVKSPPNATEDTINCRRKTNLGIRAAITTSPVSTQASSAKWLKDLIRQERYLLKLPKNRFKNIGEALPYLFRRLPLWSLQASDMNYKCTYPFTACSKEEFEMWNVGKKLAAEWSRAKTIKRILSGESYSQSWSTKAIFMYGRSHLYSPPVSSYNLFKKESLEKELILNCYSSGPTQNGRHRIGVEEMDEAINIISPVKESVDCLNSNSLDTYIDISDRKLTQECAFVKDAALDVGIILKPEEITSGVTMNATERVIFEAVKCFAENLIRRSRNFLVCDSTNYNEKTALITSKEVRKALYERKEFESIRKYRENKLAMDFFS